MSENENQQRGVVVVVREAYIKEEEMISIHCNKGPSAPTRVILNGNAKFSQLEGSRMMIKDVIDI